jgi:hypothetical protein
MPPLTCPVSLEIHHGMYAPYVCLHCHARHHLSATSLTVRPCSSTHLPRQLAATSHVAPCASTDPPHHLAATRPIQGLLHQLTCLVLEGATADSLDEHPFPGASDIPHRAPIATAHPPLRVLPVLGRIQLLHLPALAVSGPLAAPASTTCHSVLIEAGSGLEDLLEVDYLAISRLQPQQLVSFLTCTSFACGIMFSLADNEDVGSFLAALEAAAAVGGPHRR